MLAIETILGALTGYFTNDLAIRQLFAKNGVVVHERAQFTEMIVQVLEEQIIDEQMVQNLAKNPEMVMVFERFLRTLLDEEIPYVLADCALADIDIDGALWKILMAHVETFDFSGVHVNDALLAERLDAFLANPLTRQTLEKALSNIANLSFAELGMEHLLKEWHRMFAAMDASDLSKLLEELQTHMQNAVSRRWCEEGAVRMSLGEFFDLNGTGVEAELEKIILSRLPKGKARWLDVLKDPELQEHIYVLAERILSNLLPKYLPVLLKAFTPLLTSDRNTIERMLLESVSECGENPLLCEMISGLLQARFAETIDGKDWLTIALERYSGEEAVQEIAEKLKDFLLSGIVQSIDRWRRAAMDEPEELFELHQQLLRIRPLAVHFLDALLALPLRQLMPEQRIQAMITRCFALLKAQLTPALLCEKLESAMETWIQMPLSAWLLTDKRQSQLLERILEAWQEQGRALLVEMIPAETSLQEKVYRFIDWIYQEPLSCLLYRSQTVIPYQKAASALCDCTFSVMRPALRRLTKEQLDALSHAEIRELVLDMLGREMRPLAYLGAGIGAAAGAATGVAMDMSGITPDPDAVAALMAIRTGMYGVVGYGTNVAAVTGLFRPYKKTMSFQGLMSKNQARFAHKMKNMAASFVINDEIWAKQVQAICGRLNQDFDTFLHAAAIKLREADGRRFRQALKTLACENVDFWLRLSLEKKHAGKCMAAYIASNQGIRRLADACAHEHMLCRGIYYLAEREKTDGSLSAMLHERLQRMDAKTWTNVGNALLGRFLLSAKPAFYEQIWQQFLPYYKELPECLLKYSDGITEMMDGVVRQKLSFTMLLGYQLAGGKRVVEAVLMAFLSKKLPSYLFQREEAVGAIVQRLLYDTLADKSAASIGLVLSDEEGRWFKEISASFTEEQLQGILVNMLEKMGTMAPAAEARVLQDILLVLKETASDAVLQVWDAFNWDAVLLRLEPTLVRMADGVTRDFSVHETFLISQEALKTRLYSALSFSSEEKQVCKTVLEKFWRIVEPAFQAALLRDGQTLVLLVDVPGLVEERINALSPQLLEDMVRGIAQPYFKRVERMGWLGAVVAVPATILSRILGGF